MREGYDVAQVCPNGHVANSMTQMFPAHNQEHCDKCGESTITGCPNCTTPIRGWYHMPSVFGGPEYEPPAYCHKCGKPFPWTERAIQAAINLAVEFGGLQGDDAAQFGTSIREIATDTPQTQVAAHRLVRLLRKVGTTTGNAIRDILVDIASETAKKVIWPDK